ncbi:MAG: SGNH/GDSL hydrolase family protein [Dehalococcoidia bacterium]
MRIYVRFAHTDLAGALSADPYEILVEPHGVAGYRPRPSRTLSYDNGTIATINAMGFRGPVVTVPKPPGVLRIVLLGGSTTFGWGVNDDQTIDAHMRRLLAERDSSGMVDVVNLAFDGYDSYQVLERLRSDGAWLEPDVVIVNTGINDVRNAPFENLVDADPRTLLYRATLDQLRLEAARGGPTVWTRARHYLYVARLPGWLRGQWTETAVSDDAQVRWDALNYFERNIRRIQSLAGQWGAVIIFSTPPSSLPTRNAKTDPPERDYWIRDAETTQVYRDSLQARMRTVVTEASSSHGQVEYFQMPRMDVELFLDDAHLTSAGNARMAEGFISVLDHWLVEGP